MFVRRVLFVLLFLLVPTVSLADQPYLTRRDGYLLIWESIRRPVGEDLSQVFRDLPPSERGFSEITYGRGRFIIDDSEDFHPDDSLTLGDAVAWLIRTRSIVFAEDSQPHHLDSLLDRYPFVDSTVDRSRRVDEEELMMMMQTLDEFLMREEHKVSFYADDFHGQHTAFGEIFDMNAITAAHRTFPQNTLARVTNLENGKSIVVRINDRGPYVDGRDMDLSLAAFQQISSPSSGVVRARFERLGDASFFDSCSQQSRTFQKRITRDTRFHRGVPHTLSVGDVFVLQANRTFVVRGITYPGGRFEKLQNYVSSDEKFTFLATDPGQYVFLVGTADGRMREMRMKVSACVPHS